MGPNGTVDIAAGHIPITYAYSKFCDFSPAYSPYEARFLARKPAVLSAYLNLLKPFSVTIWLAIAGSVAFGAAIWALLGRFDAFNQNSYGLLDSLKPLIGQGD